MATIRSDIQTPPKISFKNRTTKWLEDDNIYKWMRTDNQMFTAKERRTLLPHRVGNAYEETARQ